MSLSAELLLLVIYVVAGRIIIRFRFPGRDAAFALINLLLIYLFFFVAHNPHLQPIFILFFASYVLTVSLQYLLMRSFAERSGALPWIAFFLPILFLAFIRYMPIVGASRYFSTYVYKVLLRHPEISLGWAFVGISYLAFRTSYLVLEVRNGVVQRPGYWRYLGFAFFAPTLWVGPISPYGLYEQAFSQDERPDIPLCRALLRVLVGAVKFRFIGLLLNQLTYSGLLLDGHPHKWFDLPISVIVYYLYLYCNFSGFCDIAVGGAGVMGIPVAENFDNPFAARNVREFWNRWHITLSNWMRDVVFSPLSKALVRWFGPANINHAIAITVFIVFLLVGIWHGVGWNYAAFGMMHGVGVVANHYYTIALKKKLGKERFAAYNRNRLIHATAVTLTFLYVAASLFLFANNWTTMKTIFSVLRA